MPRLVYSGTPKTFKPASLALIAHANTICLEYEAQGFTLTLRQLYYQMVSRDIIPNTQKQYKALGDLLTNARMRGKLDWSYLEDRGRNIDKLNQFRNAEDFLVRATESWFHIDWWKNQPVYPEVWIEKDALSGIVESATNPLDVTSLACKGYLSTSEAWQAGQRFLAQVKKGKRVVLIHLGDHDPSGMQMSEDNENRLLTFLHFDLYRELDPADASWPEVQMAARRAYGIASMEPLFEVRRIALNMDQIEQYDPPPNPAKQTDSRFAKYQEEFGDESWELDALEPQVLADLITEEIESVLDRDLMDEQTAYEEVYKDRINDMVRAHREELALNYNPNIGGN